MCIITRTIEVVIMITIDIRTIVRTIVITTIKITDTTKKVIYGTMIIIIKTVRTTMIAIRITSPSRITMCITVRNVRITKVVIVRTSP